MDTFFNGSSDVVLPEGVRRRAVGKADRSDSDLEARAPYFCERCDESIPLAQLASGRARLEYGLAFCARCSPLLEEDRYQIYFCDRCGVSVPLEKIEGGEALAGDGHVYCVRCRRRRPRVARWARISGLVLAVGLSVAGSVLLWRSPREPPPPTFASEYETVTNRIERRLAALSRTLGRSRDALREHLRQMEGQQEALDRLEGAVHMLAAATEKPISSHGAEDPGR
jgi:hypothetical protein